MMSALKTLTSQGRVLSPDLGGQARTIEVGDEIIAHMRVS
jgi:isocitrate/isopropylmalate dehydrogenase